MPDVLPGFLTGPFGLGTLPDVSEFKLKYVIVINRINKTIPKIIMNRSWSVLVLCGKDSFSPDILRVIGVSFLTTRNIPWLKEWRNLLEWPLISRFSNLAILGGLNDEIGRFC